MGSKLLHKGGVGSAMIGTLIIICQWTGFLILLYVCWYIYQCGCGIQKLSNILALRLIVLALLFMVIATTMASTYPKRRSINELAIRYDSGISQSSVATPGVDNGHT